ncbi:g protein alpha i subunit [Anaeramoeba flamelloides]|uniref:G protein alpha i subunit n=1 Tax=Anaeramoeba flamelloides TaxID=1746091 RepID=A0ABQ8ZEN7_9EUKA|nr:g protein alpha i subunit [Anaeramoeba flamelloides]
MCGCLNSKVDKQAKKRSKKIDQMGTQLKSMNNQVYRLLLLGPGESGKSTVVKQCKFLYSNGFKKSEIIKMKKDILTNAIQAIQTLIEMKDELNLQFQNRECDEFVKEVMGHGVLEPISPELATKIEKLWADSAIQQAYKVRHKFQLIQSAKYFLDQLQTIIKEDYVPTNDDLLNLRVRTSGINETRFRKDNLKFCLIDVGGQRNERKKWIHSFEEVTSVIYVTAISAYDQVLEEERTVNRMKESLMLFNDVCNSRWFTNSSLILFLNKTDIFEDKFSKKELKNVFPEYEGSDDIEDAKVFIRNQFMSLNKIQSKKVYPFFTTAINSKNIKFVFSAVMDTVLQKNITSLGFL